LILFLALAFGGSAAVGVSALVGAKSSTSNKNLDTVRIVVAATDVPRGAMITSDLVRLRDCPKDLVPLGAVTKIEDALTRAVFSPLVKDEPILEGKLAPKGAGRGLAALVPKGMRAFTISSTNITSSVAGFILPGNKVDVLLTVSNTQGDDKTGGGSTTTLLQHVEIMAVDQRVDAPVENRVDTADLRSVTLLVTPDQAAKLDLGQAKGTLHLSLRNVEDEDMANTRPATFNELRFYQDKPWDERAKGVLEALGKVVAQRPPQVVEAPAPAPPAPLLVEGPPQFRSIRIYRGTQWSLAN
jgi:pilus assembly protein CpaB